MLAPARVREGFVVKVKPALLFSEIPRAVFSRSGKRWIVVHRAARTMRFPRTVRSRSWFRATIEAMACGTPVIAWPRGSVREVIDDGVTGFIVESEAQAVAAIAQARHLDRRRIRETFERRFSARRMAEEYVQGYRTVSNPA
jgi:glycosyltransferase involved in cell wall biosynthesis